MNLNSRNTKNYKEFITYLKSFSDKKYLEFNKGLLNDNIKVIGVRTPILKEIAKQISNNNYLDFIKENKHEYYEETVIHGLIIGYLKTNFEETTSLLDDFLKYNTNWAINDITVANLKIFKKNREDGYNYILKLLDSENSFTKRFGIVLLLDFYINEEYIDKILNIVLDIHDDNYYVKMGIAWLISICYIKYPEKTIILLKNNKLDTWIHNKSIQKIIESKRISLDEKEKLRKLKKKS